MSTRTTSTVAAEVLPKNSQRKSFAIQNEDVTDSVYIKFERSELTTVSATDHDFKITPGSVLALNTNNDGAQAIQARITGVSSANTPRISFFETEDVIR
jgi:hypothetical protein